MKKTKLSLLFILFTLLISNLNAIDKKGLKLGFNLSTLTGENMDNSKFRANFSGGIYLNNRLNNWLVLQPELMFSNKGYNYDGTEKIKFDDDGDGFFDEDPLDGIDNDDDGYTDEDHPSLDFGVKGHYHLSYLEIPILLKASTVRFFSQNLNIVFGPSFNFLLDASYKLKQDGYDYHKGELTNLNSFDLCGIFGIEYNFDRFMFELRLNHSFMKDDYISTGEVVLRSLDDSEPHFGPSFEDYQDFVQFQKVNGFNTSLTMLIGVSF